MRSEKTTWMSLRRVWRRSNDLGRADRVDAGNRDNPIVSAFIEKYGHRPRLLDLFSGAGGAAMGYHRAGSDNMPYSVVLYMYGKIQRFTLLRLWQNPQGSNQEWGTNKFALSSMRSKTSGNRKTQQLGKERKPSTLERWHTFRAKWLSFNSCPIRQPLPFNGRCQGESI